MATVSQYWLFLYFRYFCAYICSDVASLKKVGGSKIIKCSQRLKAIYYTARQRRFKKKLYLPFFDLAYPRFSVLDFWVGKSTSLPLKSLNVKRELFNYNSSLCSLLFFPQNAGCPPCILWKNSRLHTTRTHVLSKYNGSLPL